MVRACSLLASGLVGMTVQHFGEVYSGVWAEVKSRKRGCCAHTGQPYTSGAMVYRPVGNPAYRMLRVKADAVQTLLATPT
jgi:hypothetical protein